MSEKVTFEKGEYGLRAILRSEWSKDVESLLLKKNISELVLNYAAGWKGKDISFISTFNNLQVVDIIDFQLPSVLQIQYLKNLRKLHIATYCDTVLDYAAFPHLQDCALEWRKKSESLFDCKQLKKLFINRYKGKDTELFSKLQSLEYLGLYNASIKTLTGLRDLKQLKHLHIANFRTLTSLAGIEGLTNLEELTIDGCRKITKIDEVLDLVHLKKLTLDEDGNINSLKPIMGLSSLQELFFCGSTNIQDGDIAFIHNLPNLKHLSFMNRKHYSNKREDFPEYFAKRE